ncbi:ORC1-type DNA replication protein [Candidatus Woesearchaeota archaeon]|nr:MAG: ORC1-type DNA replication protein [Candidatus Woesearchaeota archaeon]
MPKEPLSGFFESFLRKDSLFVNKRALQASYMPEEVPHREEQIKEIALILAPALRLERPSNLFIYGRTGSGKTLSARKTTERLAKVALQSELPVRTVYVNCKLKGIADTEYRLIAHLAREFGKAIPATGLPTDEVYRSFLEGIDTKQVVIFVLDEIDQLVKKAGDEILYNLTRINEELKHCQVSIVGISNDLQFVTNLDPRVKSSLSEEEIVFPPYNALQLQGILKSRAKLAFKEGVLSEGVIEKCAAYAARDHGDARKALELLRVAGELAEREGSKKVNLEHLDKAEDKIDRDRIIDIVNVQPKQFQAVLYSAVLIKIKEPKKEIIFTGELYNYYKDICKKSRLRPLTQRRVSDVITELDSLSLVSARIISKGRYGRTREIILSIPDSSIPVVKKMLEESLSIR